MTPTISVLTTCYNDGEWLERAARSVLQQTEAAVELLLYDNGSTDPEVGRIMQRLRDIDSRVRCFSTESCPVPAVFNRLASQATGRWLLILNADDWLEPDGCERILNAAALHPEVNVIFSPWQWEGARSGIYDFRPYNPTTMIEEHQISGCRAVRRDFWMRTGGEDESIPIGADWDWAVRASQMGMVPLKIERPLWHVWDHGAGVSRLSTPDNWLPVREQVRAHMRTHLAR